MSLDGTAVQKLRESFAEPRPVEAAIGEATAVPAGWTIQRRERKVVGGLTLHSLTGIADYVVAGVDPLPTKMLLHVSDERAVDLYGPVEDEAHDFRRHLFVSAHVPATAFPFGQMIDHERFVIGLQTSFQQTDERDELLALVSKISEREVRESNDDGIGQEVTVTRGVTTVGRVKLPNPVRLVPGRTFLEVEQPDSLFVLRARGGGEMPSLGLFEADGAGWKLEAIQSIAAWLRKNDALKGVSVVA